MTQAKRDKRENRIRFLQALLRTDTLPELDEPLEIELIGLLEELHWEFYSHKCLTCPLVGKEECEVRIERLQDNRGVIFCGFDYLGEVEE